LKFTQYRSKINCAERAHGRFPATFTTEALYARIIVRLKRRVNACVSNTSGEIFQIHITPPYYGRFLLLSLDVRIM
jgi:hypothetical protein